MTTKPWQIVALATLCFIQAAHVLNVVVTDLLVRANPPSAADWADSGTRLVQSHLVDDQGTDLSAVYLYLANSQYVYTIMMVVIFMFGFLLYRGEYLPAVRVTGTIFFLVVLIGEVAAALFYDDGTIVDVYNDGTLLETSLVSLLSMGFDALLVVGFISLFFGKSAQWVKSHTDSS